MRGYETTFINNEWVYDDNGQSVVETWLERPCGHCGLNNTSEGHDGCLGILPGITNACCGHGDVNEAYIQFSNYECIRGDEALKLIEQIKEKE